MTPYMNFAVFYPLLLLFSHFFLGTIKLTFGEYLKGLFFFENRLFETGFSNVCLVDRDVKE